MFWLYRQHAAARLSSPRGESAEGPVLGSWSLMNLYAGWTRFTLKGMRAAIFLGAELAISILPYRSLSAPEFTQRETREKRWGAGGGIETDSGWSEDHPVSEPWAEGAGGSDTSQGWRLMVQKTSKTVDANGVETKAQRGNKEERVEEVGSIIKR